MEDILSKFCLRICHDLLSPIGAMQIAIDNEDYEVCQQAIDRIVKIFELLRKAYGYDLMFMQNSQLKKFLAEYGMSVQDPGIPEGIGDSNKTSITPTGGKQEASCTKWDKSILRLSVWLKYKHPGSVVVKPGKDEATITITDIILKQEEEDLLSGKAVEVDLYNIYLHLFVSSEKALTYKYNNNTLVISMKCS